MSDGPIVVHEICPICVLPSKFSEADGMRACHTCDKRSIRGLWRSVAESGSKRMAGRVRHYRSGSEGRLAHASYRGMIHGLGGERLSTADFIDEAVGYLPEGAEVEIEVRWKWRASEPAPEGDYWTLLRPHKYGPAEGK